MSRDDVNELEELEKLEKECKEGNCPFFNHAWKGYSCSPHSGACNSGVDENGDVYCDRIHGKILDIIHGEEDE